MYIYIHIYIYMCVCVFIYMYINMTIYIFIYCLHTIDFRALFVATLGTFHAYSGGPETFAVHRVDPQL